MSKIIQLDKHRKPPIKGRIGVIIQARMTSKRFPGKVMAHVWGKPCIQWVMERAKLIRAPKGYEIFHILAVPDDDLSEVLISLAADLDVQNFCGSEDNVLERCYQAARFFGLSHIVRITGDCPFIDPTVCSQVVQLLLWRRLDYASNVHPVRTYPAGLDCEAFTLDALEAAYKLAESPYDREHVTSWMQRTKELKTGNVVQKENMSHKNWCVDVPDDILRIEQEIRDSKIGILTIKGANDDKPA